MTKTTNNNLSLHNKLEKYCTSDYLPMHMPGHKRNPAVSLPSYSTDITEIDGFDNLHSPEGLIKDLSTKAASMWNADKCILSVNGSTGLIVSSVRALTSLGSILIASNCHISVWHGIELSGTHAYTIEAPFMLPISPSLILEKLESHPDIKSVILTSPTYEGVISDIESIYGICKEHNILLMVDEAHGAHLGIDPYFPTSSYADIVIKSIHKTLNAPTQTALLLTYGNRAPYRLINHYMDSMESTSPSYILMSGISKCINTISSQDAAKEWISGIGIARSKLKTLTNLSLFESDDPSKFVIMCDTSISGFELADKLRTDYRIEIEASFPAYIIAMSGIGDSSDSMERFADAILDIDNSLGNGSPVSTSSVYNHVDEISGTEITSAITAPCKELDIDKCLNHISACYAFAYPPGVPIVIPGQVIDESVIHNLQELSVLKIHLNTEPACASNQLLVVDTN